jgi:hypothetical protein
MRGMMRPSDCERAMLSARPRPRKPRDAATWRFLPYARERVGEVTAA